MEKYRKMLTIS
jgi:cyanate lyase